LTDGRIEPGGMYSILSLIYLALPVAIFLASWLWWPYAITLMALLALALGRAAVRIRRAVTRGVETRPSISGGDAIGVGIVTLLLACYSGAGGFGYQRGDWPKHNAMLAELSGRDWPVRLEGEPGIADGSYLTYYVAYYLPAAVIGRSFGIEAAHMALFVWTLAGLVLAAVWVLRLVPYAGWAIWAAWFLLSGLDVVAAAIVWMIGTGWQLSQGMDWWPRFGSYTCNMGLLLWVPQHMLAGWIGTALIVARAEEQGDVSIAPLVMSLTIMWSPFVSLGLAPIILAAMTRTGWRSAFHVDLAASVAIALVSVAALAGIGQQAVPQGLSAGFIGFVPWLLTWIGIIVIEFGFYAALALWLLRTSRDSPDTIAWNRTWVVTAVVVLVALPVYRLGLYNDLMTRSSIPALFVMWMVVLRVLRIELHSRLRPAASVLIACLAVAALLPLNQIRVQLWRTRTWPQFAGANSAPPIGSLEPRIRDQYIGSADSFFARHLAP
jgi:hypothetical protein